MVPKREEYRGLMTKNWNKLYGSAVESSFLKWTGYVMMEYNFAPEKEPFKF